VGGTLRLQITATDPQGQPVRLTADELPAGASFADNGDGTGDFSWKPGTGAQGTYRVTFSATVSGCPSACTSMSVLLSVFREGDVDRDDVDLILERIDETPQQNDPRDVDQNGHTTVLDARKAAINCTRPGCAVQ
jgi:hypothetical protein